MVGADMVGVRAGAITASSSITASFTGTISTQAGAAASAEVPHGPTMARIAMASPIRALPCPTDTEAPYARTYNRARLRDRRNREVLPPHRERNEWAIGRLRRAPHARTGARSAVFAMAARRGRIATTGIRALDQPEAEGPREEEDRAEAVEATQAAGAATAVPVVDTDSSERKPWQA